MIVDQETTEVLSLLAIKLSCGFERDEVIALMLVVHDLMLRAQRETRVQDLSLTTIH